MSLYKREMVRHQSRETGRSVQGEDLVVFFKKIVQLHSPHEITFVCIGTDRSTGDALGPLTGSLLQEHGVKHVVGTLASPCDADSLEKRLALVPSHHAIIAIDACLGPKQATGTYYLADHALVPAKSVNGKLPPVGHYSVAAVVNANGPRPYSILQMTSLHFVMGMSRTIAEAVVEALE
ncbi:spore protease YyaC [Paenibacillus sp. JNUCC31]|uniref:spore protease YyaC n=1 Tax=Paenibacillus sp. JNUCC-31 TaxID=2777983 RepID=UPI001E60D755|nr:spore protease YyaC [Paenibacillus sp. JNUCC-31]